MTENYNNRQNVNLREALRREEVERPPMPADLNERVMQRIASQPKQHRVVWPWVAAACVAGLLAVLLMPPENESEMGVVAEVQESLTPPLTPPLQGRGVAAPERAEAQHASATVSSPKVQKPTVEHADMLLAQETPKVPPANEAGRELAIAQSSEVANTQTSGVSAAQPSEVASAQPDGAATPLPCRGGAGVGSVTDSEPAPLTERDIPITRPENLKYTPEEIALMKKQADEAYLKWVELELEIAKYNIEQTAQK